MGGDLLDRPEFRIVFMPISVGFMPSGVSPRSGYLKHLLGADTAGRLQKFRWSGAYRNSFDGEQHMFRRNPELSSLVLDISLKKLSPKINPSVYCWINHNYIVHWRAIRELRPEKNWRRLEVCWIPELQ